MAHKIGRNDLCWCGSGKKYKKCHLYREKQEEVPFYEISQDFKKAFKTKMCMVPDELKYECDEKIIKAHTISKGANLKHIAKDNKVYTVEMDFLKIKSNSKLIRLKLKHINQASIFYIFCKKHDKELFSPLEDEAFVASNQQIFLLSYRIVSKLIYMKEQQINLLKNKVINYDKGLKETQQQYLQSFAQIFSNNDSQLKDIKNIKSVFDRDLLKKDYNNIKYYYMVIDKVPEIMNSGGFLPSLDFDGNELIDFINNPSDEYNSILLSIIKTDDNHGAIILSWNENINSKECIQFIDCLNNLSDENKIKAITCLCFTEVKENLHISPVWYDGLSNERKKFVDSCYVFNRYLDGISIPLPPFELYDYKKFDFFNWNIVEIQTNFELNKGL